MKVGFWESGILGKWDFGKVGFVGKMDVGKIGFYESGILGKCDFGKV